MDKLLAWIVKAMLVLIFAPLLLCLAFQWATAIVVAILPWLVGIAVLAALTTGISAGLALRKRLPPSWEGRSMPPGTHPGAYRVRRERGARR
jgi:hypothetical protein